MDASLDATSDKTVQAVKGEIQYKRGTSSVATIRHFFVEEQYREASIQQDLLEHAISHALQSDKSVQKIRVSDSPLLSYITKVLKEAGFAVEEKTGRIGILQWQQCTRSLDRGRWRKSSEQH